jgi:hypothetical protein
MTIIASKLTKEWNFMREQEEQLSLNIGSIYYNLKRNLASGGNDFGKVSTVFSECILKLAEFSDSE